MKQIIYLFLFGISFCSCSPAVNIQPHDIIEEAKGQVAELRTLIQAKIYVGLDVITNVAYDLYFYRDKSNNAARTAFRQEYDNFIAQLNTLDDLGESAGVDVTSCTTSHVRPIYMLRVELETSLLNCYYWATDELLIVEKDSKYYVDIIMTEVEVLDFQLNACKGELLCISPLLTKIETAMIELPQKIDQETNKSKDLAANLKILIDQCSAQGVAEMMAKGNTMVAEAEDCVQKMLS